MELRGLPLRWPLVGAPMAGGPSCPALAAAVCNAGGLGFLAAGYLSADQLGRDIAEARGLTARGFGVNLFVGQPDEIDGPAVAAYLASIAPDAAAVGAAVGSPAWDDDDWSAKIDLLVANRVPIVSFTFGNPAPDVMARLHAAGSAVVVTVTTPDEAQLAAALGADALCLQGIEAGGHQGRFDDRATGDGWPLHDLVGVVRAANDLPLIAAGGLMTGTDIAAVIGAGADAAQLGTALLRTPESGATELYKAALVDPQFAETAITRAFSGRRARGLVNDFMRAHPDAPTAYPQINNATRPMRAAARAAGDPHRVNLWAGIGFRRAEARPAAEVIARIGAELDLALASA